jgi:hypothetical protein
VWVIKLEYHIGAHIAWAVAALIGLGHVAVRKLSYRYGTKPAPFFLGLGLAFLGLSLLVTSNLASAALGIVRMTTLWDAVEFVRQEERIRRGHAPANPDRPVKLRPR